jgi:replicative DNA helicase
MTNPAMQDLPPHSPDDEKALLGSCIADPDNCLPVTVARLCGDPTAFYETPHQNLFRTLVLMHRERKTIDLTTIYRTLNDAGQTTNCGGLDYISTLIDKHGLPLNFEAYLDQVRDRWIRRDVLMAAVQFEKAVCNPSLRAEDALDFFQRNVHDIAEKTGKPDLATSRRTLDSLRFDLAKEPPPSVRFTV